MGKILAEVLGYSFFDSDKLVEQAGMPSVALIFKVHCQKKKIFKVHSEVFSERMR